MFYQQIQLYLLFEYILERKLTRAFCYKLSFSITNHIIDYLSFKNNEIMHPYNEYVMFNTHFP